MVKKIGLKDVYLEPDETYNITSITLSDDLVLSIGIADTSITQTEDLDPNSLPLNNYFIKKDNDFVSDVILTDDLNLYVFYDTIAKIDFEPDKYYVKKNQSINITLTVLGYDNQPLTHRPLKIWGVEK